MKQLAILILKTGDETQFEATLASVLANRPPNCEIVVFCPGGYADPYGLADEVSFVEMPACTGAGWIREGMKSVAPASEVIHLLASGLEVDEGWTDGPRTRLADPSVAAISMLVVGSDGVIDSAGIRSTVTGQFAAVAAGRKLNSRRRIRTWGPSFSAAFFRRDAIEEIAPLDPVFDSWLADADVAATLKEKGMRIELAESLPIRGRINLSSQCTPFKESQLIERLYWKHRPSLWRTPMHSFGWLAEAIWCIPRGELPHRALGRLSGLILAPLDAIRRRRLSQSNSPTSASRTDVQRLHNVVEDRRKAA